MVVAGSPLTIGITFWAGRDGPYLASASCLVVPTINLLQVVYGLWFMVDAGSPSMFKHPLYLWAKPHGLTRGLAMTAVNLLRTLG